jgi:hypothetical protein
MEAKFNSSIVALTDESARQHLNEEYAQLIWQTIAALCRKHPSPLDKGQVKTWAFVSGVESHLAQDKANQNWCGMLPV